MTTQSQLILRTTHAKNGKLYYYAYNAATDSYQRISRDVFYDWLRTYFGLNKTQSHHVPSNLNDHHGYWYVTPKH